MAETEAFNNIKSIILKHSGLYFKEHDMPSLEISVKARMTATKSKSYSEYYKLLMESSDSNKEFTELLNLLTNKHTHFFRYHAQFAALRDHILPAILERKRKSSNFTIRILSAGCATGEEPYSIAMACLDLLVRMPQWKIRILAVDISTKALASAKKGVYPARSLKNVDKEFINRYMEKFCLIAKDRIIVAQAVKKLVEFRYLNLIGESYPRGFDIIFCRNVTIYFEREMMKKVVDKLHESLNDGGFLFSGSTETLYNISDKFEMMDMGDALVYKKIHEAGPSAQIKAGISPGYGERPPRRKIPAAMAEAERPAKEALTLNRAHGLLEKGRGLFVKKDYEASIKSLEDSLAIAPRLEASHLLLARIFTNQGRLKEAEEECKAIIDINPLSAEPYYLLGLAYKNKKRGNDALNNLKKTVYLYPHYSLAYFDMADLYRKKGELAKSLKAYKNTLKALEDEPDGHFKEISGGLNKTILAQAAARRIKELSHLKR